MLAIAMLAIALALQQPIQSLLHCASLQGEILVKRVELQLLSLANLTGFQLSLRGLPLFKEAGLRLMSLAKLPRAQLLPSPRGVLSVVSENPFLLCGTRDTCRLLFLLPPPTFPRTLGPLLLLLVLRRGTPLAQLRVEILLREPYARAFYDTTGTTTFVISPAVIISRAASAPFGRRGSLELVVERSPGRSRGAIRTSHPVKFNLGARFARVKAANAPTAILRSSESAGKKPTGLFQMLILVL